MKSKKIFMAILFLAFTTCLMAQRKDIVLHRDKGSITFTVDENLPAPTVGYRNVDSGEQLARVLARDMNLVKPDEGLVASSFANDQMEYGGKDLLFRTIVKCFAEHRPLVLSPDMVWLVIAQGFSHYVNTHAESMRDKLVGHDGKLSLVVETGNDLLSAGADWPEILSGFEQQIAGSTKGDVAQTVTANFTTTGLSERIASQVTLMDVMKEYFEYIVVYVSCGIPNITLQGTPEDWQKVHDKAMALGAYGMEWWTRGLDPILTEFVRAAEGHPNQRHWQDMVMKQTPERLRGGGCDFSKPTELDGWMLKLFPFDKDGKRIPETIPHNKQMLSEMVDVPFRYIYVHRDGKTTETPMQLYAGFVGVREDTVSCALTPQIGWMVRVSESPDLLSRKMEEKANDEGSYGGLELRVKKVPEALKNLTHIKRLSLTFTGHIELPLWMDHIEIEQFGIEGGELTHAEEKALKQRFPTLRLSHVTYVDDMSFAEEAIYEMPDTFASFPGGEEAMYEWISANLRFPEALRKKGIQQGRVIAMFVVEKDGSIGRVSIMKSSDIELSDVASRLLLSMPKWKPGQVDGRPVRSFFTLPMVLGLQVSRWVLSVRAGNADDVGKDSGCGDACSGSVAGDNHGVGAIALGVEEDDVVGAFEVVGGMEGVYLL